MKLYNAKLNRTMEGTAIMLKSLRFKGWVEVPEEEVADLNNEEVEADEEEVIEEKPWDTDQEYAEKKTKTVKQATDKKSKQTKNKK